MSTYDQMKRMIRGETKHPARLWWEDFTAAVAETWHGLRKWWRPWR